MLLIGCDTLAYNSCIRMHIVMLNLPLALDGTNARGASKQYATAFFHGFNTLRPKCNLNVKTRC